MNKKKWSDTAVVHGNDSTRLCSKSSHALHKQPTLRVFRDSRGLFCDCSLTNYQLVVCYYRWQIFICVFSVI